MVARPFRKFFEGLSDLPADIRDHIAGIIGDAFPRYTDRLADWSIQMGSPTTMTREALEAEQEADGAQSPGEFQHILQAAGFPVFVHEWWEPGSEPPVLRVPETYIAIPPARVLTNDISTVQKRYRHQFGTRSQFKSNGSVRFGTYNGYQFYTKSYPNPTTDAERTNYFYVCGETFPDPVSIDFAVFPELERLIYKYKPAHLRCVLIAYKGIDIIQDSIIETEIYQDSISETETIQDKAV